MEEKERMPELPEVETIRRAILPELQGHRFVKIQLLWPGSVRGLSPEDFAQGLADQEVKDVRRRGKYLIIDLSQGRKLILHLKMTGCLLIQPCSAIPASHTRAILHLDSNNSLHLTDQRKFGGMWLVEDENEVVGTLGPEPLDSRFSPWALRKALRQHSIPIKALLCDQRIIAGIGNMYADEALYEARIHPLRKANSMTPAESDRLHRAVCHVLIEGIARCGASVNTYQQPNGEPGFAHLFFQVAHRRGERCYHCRTPISRISIRGRGTYFCPKCQPIPAGIA